MFCDTLRSRSHGPHSFKGVYTNIYDRLLSWCRKEWILVRRGQTRLSFHFVYCGAISAVNFLKCPMMQMQMLCIYEDISFFVFETLCSFCPSDVCWCFHAECTSHHSRCIQMPGVNWPFLIWSPETTLMSASYVPPPSWCMCLFTLLQACFFAAQFSPQIVHEPEN